MDPATAAASAIAAYFNYLCTPAGQEFAHNVNKRAESFLTLLEGLIPKQPTVNK